MNQNLNNIRFNFWTKIIKQKKLQQISLIWYFLLFFNVVWKWKQNEYWWYFKLLYEKKKEETLFSCEWFLKNNSLIVEMANIFYIVSAILDKIICSCLFHSSLYTILLLIFYLLFLFIYFLFIFFNRIHTSHYLYLFKSYWFRSK